MSIRTPASGELIASLGYFFTLAVFTLALALIAGISDAPFFVEACVANAMAIITASYIAEISEKRVATLNLGNLLSLRHIIRSLLAVGATFFGMSILLGSAMIYLAEEDMQWVNFRLMSAGVSGCVLLTGMTDAVIAGRAKPHRRIRNKFRRLLWTLVAIAAQVFLAFLLLASKLGEGTGRPFIWTYAILLITICILVVGWRLVRFRHAN